MYSRDELFLRSLECYFNPLVSAEKDGHSSAHIILYWFDIWNSYNYDIFSKTIRLRIICDSPEHQGLASRDLR